MRNIKLVLEYDGTDFQGWQVQKAGRTVQGVLQQALASLISERPTIYSAGRTDAGVHALGQVANFKTDSTFQERQFEGGLNAYLPRDVRVRSADVAAPDFHSRFHAVRRHYRYVLSLRPVAVGRQFTWYCPYPLQPDAMREASQHLIGDRVFEAFSRRNQIEKHYRCRVDAAEWHEDGEKLIFEICANRFLHNMVRIIVGTMVEVGRGKLKPREIDEILNRRERDRAGAKVPPQGLFLRKVEYE